MTNRIVILDGHTLAPAQADPSELNFEAFKLINDVSCVDIYPRTNEAELLERIGDASIVLTNKVPLSQATLAALPNLKYIGVTATGVNVVDLNAAREHNVTVTNVPGYGTTSVAQHVFALLLELTNHAAAHHMAVRPTEGYAGWPGSVDWSFTVGSITELADKTLGIVGLGSIGTQVARIGSALGMQIAAAHQSSMHEKKIHGIEIEWLASDDLFAKADVISLHCPLTDQTKDMVNAARLQAMKPTAFLINTGRGPLIDELALAQALKQGAIAGAGLDVLSQEPPAADNPLLGAPHCVITPHVAWASLDARRRLLQIAVDNVRAYLQGKPVNVVS